MASLSQVKMAHLPHHDGSIRYVSNQQPKLLQNVAIRIRIHSELGKVAAVQVRYSESGEAFPTPPAKLVRTDGKWSWYEAQICLNNPQVNYRFLITLTSGVRYFYNAVGLFETDQPDINDFRINTFSSAPKWGAETVMYQVFPDRFARSKNADSQKLPEWAVAANWDDEVIGEGPGVSTQFFGGDLWGVIEHLGHLKKIGANLLYLTPVFPAQSNHRYDATSFAKVDDLLGGDEAFSALIAEAHRRKIRVMGDLTSNHSGDGHEWFKAAYKNPGAPESNFYYFRDGNTNYDCWFGHRSLPKFNWKSEELRNRFIQGGESVVARWLKPPFGLDGWRIDVANMTGRVRDEDMYLEVSKVIRKTMVDVNPDTLIIGEYTGDAAYEVQGNGWAGAMTYANFTKPLWRWLFEPKLAPIDLQNIGYVGRVESAKNFVEDQVRFAAAFPWHVRQNTMNALNTHDTPRFKTFTRSGAQRVAVGMQFTMPGIPVIWAGDEFGLDGENGEKSRTPIPWNNERTHDASMIGVYSALSKLRKKYKALTQGSLRYLFANDEALIFTRETASETLLILATRGAAKAVEIPADAAPQLAAAKLVYGKATLKVGKNKAKFSAGKLEFAVWHLPAGA